MTDVAEVPVPHPPSAMVLLHPRDPMVPSNTIGQSLERTTALGVPRLEAQMLLLHVLGRPTHDRAWLIAHDTDLITAQAQAQLDTLVMRHLEGVPIAYLTGEKEFYGLRLHVDQRVLDPRDDTETLVDWALWLLPADQPTRVLDLGTGSGAIALAIAHHRPQAQVTAVDVSAEALSVAQTNGQRLGLKIDWRQGHWWQPLQGFVFDLIVSNPPYIAAHDTHLKALRHEPFQALVSFDNGLGDLREIIEGAPDYLSQGGWLLLEHGWQQAASVRDMLHRSGLTQIMTKCDLAAIERCSGGQRSA